MTQRLLIFLFLLTSFAQAQPTAKIISGKVFSEKYLVLPININSTSADFSPFVLKNKLYFVSNRNENSVVAYTSNNQNTSNIFICEKLDSLRFSKPKPLAEIGSVFDDGPVMVNAAANYMVFSAGGKNSKLQLYFSVFENQKWSGPIMHPVSRAANSYCHPFLSADGKTLFFSSDIDGGFGGMDLYYSRFENLNWSNPINLGPKVNSASNEIFPFISTDQHLYFSSKRKSGFGNLDIYSFDLNDSAKSKIKLLEAPLNSSEDDFGFFTDSNSDDGYFSSNRNANEGDNIFYFSKIIPDFKDCSPMKKSNCYTFFKDNYLYKDDAKGEYEWDFGDGNKAKAKGVKHCYSAPGFYTVKLNVIEKPSGKIIYNELAYTIAVRPEGLAIAVKDTLFINTPLLFDASSSVIDGYSILKYSWMFNDSSYLKGASAIHQYTKNGIYLVELNVQAQNLITKQIKTFCIDKWILVGDKEYVEKNLRFFKYAELMPDADSLYFQNEEELGFAAMDKTKTFHYSKLAEDAFLLTGQEQGDVLLNESELAARTHKFSLLGADGSSLNGMNEEDAALIEKAKRLRTHKYGELNADGSSMENLTEEDATMRARHRLLRMKNASLPPIVDTLYFPKESDETVFRVNLGSSDSKIDKSSGVFDGIQKLEEIREGRGYRYTSGKEKNLSAIVPYYENAKQKGFKDAEVVGFINETIGSRKAKSLLAVIFDSASVEKQAVKVYFKYDVASYDSKYNQELDSLLKKTTQKENQKVLLITHFDGLGELKYNMNLNTRRTNNMINFLVSKGIKKSQIKTEFIIHPTEKLEPDLLRRIEVFLMN